MKQGRGASGGRDELVVALAAALGREEVVIAAALAVGVLAADTRSRVVDRAAALFGVEELANPLEDVVLLVAQDALAVSDLGVTLLGLLVSEAEVFGEPPDV